jgi:hypothetical protein
MSKVMVATPMYGGLCHATYVQGLLLSTTHLKNEGVGTLWVNITNESLITRARNELTRLFLDETDATHMMFIDADIGFGYDTVKILLDADVDVACGIYPKKEVNWKAVAAAAADGKENLSDYAGSFVLNMTQEAVTTDDKGMIEVRHGGTGFMLIKRSVFEALDDKVPTYRTNTAKDADGNYLMPLTKEFFATSIDSSGALLSEDFHFCDLWRKHGGRIFANPFIKLSHAGTHFFTGDIIKSGINQS